MAFFNEGLRVKHSGLLNYQFKNVQKSPHDAGLVAKICLEIIGINQITFFDSCIQAGTKEIVCFEYGSVDCVHLCIQEVVL